MIINQQAGHIEKSSDLAVQDFRIANSRKAFEILSAGLYSDKIGAVIRELSTNAADSHTAANQTIPFEVHLPTNLEPWFAVRDYGTGMSHEQIQTLYTTYFESNRTTSNKFTGCLGLGSKAPFAYTDQFTVEARQKGEQRLYSCFINENGTPSVALLGKTTTKEPDGVEIKLAVKPISQNEFASKASQILSWFSPRPEVNGHPNFKFEEINYLHRMHDFGLCRHNQGHSCAIMGNVAYTIASDKVADYNTDIRALLDHGVHLYVPIGSVEIAANREQLGYTKGTINALKTQCNSVLKSLETYGQQILAGAKTLWEARRIMHDYSELSFYNRFMPKKVMWKGKSVSVSVLLSDYQERPSVVESVEQRFGRLRKYTTDHIDANGDPVFINDLKRGVYNTVKLWLTANNKRKAYILSQAPIVPDPSDKRPNFQDCGVFEVAVKTSTLPKPPVTPRMAGIGSGRVEHTTLLHWNTDKWEPVKQNLSKGGTYSVIRRYIARDFAAVHKGRHLVVDAPVDFNLRPRLLRHMLAALDILGTKVDLCGIRPSDEDKLKKHKGKWTALEDVVAAAVDKHQHLDKVAQLHNEMIWVENKGFMAHLVKHTLHQNSKLTKVVEDYLEATNALKINTDRLEAYRSLLPYVYPDKANTHHDQYRLNNMIQAAIKTHYPLLHEVSLDKVPIKEALGYIDYKDQSR